MDVIALAVAGFRGAVAPLGTALTEDQLALLWRFADEPVLCFDGDKAGLRAAHRAIDLALPALRPGKSLRFALLPEGLDPDDMIARHGADAMGEVIGRAQPLIDLLWQREYEAGDWSTPERRAAFEARLGDLSRSIGDEAVRRHYRDALDGRLAGLGGRPARDHWKRDRKRTASFRGRRDRFATPRIVAPVAGTLSSRRVAAPGVRITEREALILLGALHHPQLADSHAETFSALDFSDPRLAALRDQIIDAVTDDEPAESGNESGDGAKTLRARIARTPAGAALDQVEAAVTHGSYWWLADDADLNDAECAWMQLVTFHHRVVTLHRELREAERALSEDGTEESFERLRDINAQIRSLTGSEALVDGFGDASGRKAKVV